MAPPESTRRALDEALTRIEALERRIGDDATELARLREELLRLRDRSLPAKAPPPLEAPPVPAPAPVLVLPPPLPPPVAPGGGAEGTTDATERIAGKEPPPVRTAPREDLETRIGVYWFNRIGLLSLIVAFALFARYVHGVLQPWHKVGLLYAVSVGMAAAGILLDRRLRQFARPVIASGLSLAFFTSFAAHFVPATACLPLTASLALMLASVGGIFTFAERWRSEATAGLAVFFGHAAALVGGPEAGLFSAVAILFLSGTAVAMMLRHLWLPIQLLAVVTAFGSHLAWAVRTPMDVPPGQAFWLHLGFLSSYYLVFLVGDLAAQVRLGRGDASAGPPATRLAGRAAGPGAMILYATAGAWVFHRTDVHLDRIHWFLLALAAVQFGIGAFRRAVGGRDQPFYAAAGVTFATLGILNLFQGLTLNLLLAAEALMLLILARRLRWWVLTPLAEVVLAVNFVHFWTSDARRIETWPVFCGSIATSAVYLLKARLAETWNRAAADTVEAWGGAQRRWFERLLPRLAHVHGALAGVLLVYQCGRFFAEPMESAVLVGAALLLTGALAMVPCRPWHWTIVVIHASVVVMFAGRGAGGGALSAAIAPTWVMHQGLCIAVVAASIAAIAWARRRAVPFYAVVGLTHLGAAAGLVYFAAGIGVAPDGWPWIGLVAPLAGWTAAAWPRTLGPVPDASFSPGWPRGIERALAAQWGGARVAVAAAGALLLTATVLRIAPSHPAALWFLGTFSLAAAALATVRSDPAVAAGVLVHLAALAIARFGWAGLDRLFITPRLDGWLAFSTALAAAGLAGGSLRRGRPSLMGVALGALLIHGAMLVALAWRNPAVFEPLWPWLGCLAPMAATIECVAVGQRRRQDRGVVGRRRFLIGFAAAVAGALLWAWILALAVPPGFPRWRAEWWFAAAFLALAIGLRSPAAGAACGVHLILAHAWFLLGLFPGDPSPEAWFLASLAHPGWTMALVAVTVVGGVAAELSPRVSLRDPPPRVRNWLRIAAVSASAAALVTGAVFCGAQTGRFTDAPALRWAGQLAIASILALAGGGLRLPWMTGSAAVHGGLTVLVLSGLAIADPARQGQFHVAGPAIALQVVWMERCLCRVEPFAAPAWRGLRRVMAVLAGAVLMVAFHGSAEIGGTWTTLGWSLSALGLMALGFALRFSSYRRVAVVLFAASVARVVLVDLAGLDPLYRIWALLALGLCLVLTSYLYSRYRDQIQKWL